MAYRLIFTDIQYLHWVDIRYFISANSNQYLVYFTLADIRLPYILSFANILYLFGWTPSHIWKKNSQYIGLPVYQYAIPKQHATMKVLLCVWVIISQRAAFPKM